MKSNMKTSRTNITSDKGIWVYCEHCGNAVAYLSDYHSNYFKYHYKCNCGNHGSIELGNNINNEISKKSNLTISKNKMRCPNDNSPLISILDKNIERFEFEVICKACGNAYHEKI